MKMMVPNTATKMRVKNEITGRKNGKNNGDVYPFYIINSLLIVGSNGGSCGRGQPFFVPASARKMFIHRSGALAETTRPMAYSITQAVIVVAV